MSKYVMNCCVNIGLAGALALLLTISTVAEEVGERWGTEKREREFYRLVACHCQRER